MRYPKLDTRNLRHPASGFSPPLTITDLLSLRRSVPVGHVTGGFNDAAFPADKRVALSRINDHHPGMDHAALL